MCVWLTNTLYYCTAECNRALHVKSFPSPHLRSPCPFPSPRFFNFPSSFNLSALFPPFPLSPQVWVWKLERGQLIQQPVHQKTEVVEEGSWAGEEAHITTHWPTYTSTQLIESYVEACGQSRVGVECQPANGIGQSSQSSCTVSIQFSVIIQQPREWARHGEKRVTDERHWKWAKERDRRGRGWDRERKIRKAKEWSRTWLKQTKINSSLVCSHPYCLTALQLQTDEG